MTSSEYGFPTREVALEMRLEVSNCQEYMSVRVSETVHEFHQTRASGAEKIPPVQKKPSFLAKHA
jgi:hypothetical protein